MDVSDVELLPREEWIVQESAAYPDKPREYWDRLYDVLEAREKTGA